MIKGDGGKERTREREREREARANLLGEMKRECYYGRPSNIQLHFSGIIATRSETKTSITI